MTNEDFENELKSLSDRIKELRALLAVEREPVLEEGDLVTWAGGAAARYFWPAVVVEVVGNTVTVIFFGDHAVRKKGLRGKFLLTELKRVTE